MISATSGAGALQLGAQLTSEAQGFLRASESPNTRRAHESDWRGFQQWCAKKGVEALPASPETVAAYLVDLAASRKPSTLQRHLSTISQAHQAANLDSPTRSLLVRKILAGIKRTKGIAPSKKTPLLVDEIRALSKALHTSELLDIRDRALILTTFACALRRSEVSALNVEDVEFTKRGYVLTKRRSKTDQLGKGQKIAVSYGDTESCPVIALRGWIKAAKLQEGVLFRPIGERRGAPSLDPERLGGQQVSTIIKRRVKLLGLDPRKFGGHSLRSGFITSAAEAGVAERLIAKVSGHRDMTTLRGYIQEADIEADELSRKIGL